MKRTRIIAAQFCIRAGGFIQSLAAAIMRPPDLIGFSRINYSGSEQVRSFGDAGWVDSGLNQNEKEILEKLPPGARRILVLGAGGGREALALAKAGHRVTGVDFIPAMIASLQENARRRHLQVEGSVQDISRLEMPPNLFDVAWLCTNMYSCIPTRKKRISMARHISESLVAGGYLICHFYLDPGKRESRFSFAAKKAIARLTFGNVSLERGDRLWRNREFLHAFSSLQEVEAELNEAGFGLFLAPCTKEQNNMALFKKTSRNGVKWN